MPGAGVPCRSSAKGPPFVAFNSGHASYITMPGISSTNTAVRAVRDSRRRPAVATTPDSSIALTAVSIASRIAGLWSAFPSSCDFSITARIDRIKALAPVTAITLRLVKTEVLPLAYCSSLATLEINTALTLDAVLVVVSCMKRTQADQRLGDPLLDVLNSKVTVLLLV